jgi:hypothetical protein
MRYIEIEVMKKNQSDDYLPLYDIPVLSPFIQYSCIVSLYTIFLSISLGGVVCLVVSKITLLKCNSVCWSLMNKTCAVHYKIYSCHDIDM